MLALSSYILNKPILSIHFGGKIASVKSAVINPDNLKVVGLSLTVAASPSVETFLLIGDIREIGPMGFIIDDADEFIRTGDVVKFDEINSIGFSMEKAVVIDENGKKVGKVKDYSIDLDNFFVKKIHVRRGVFGRINDTELIIDRSQVIEVGNDYIKIVDSREKKLKEVEVEEPETLAYVNPFRKPIPAQPETISPQEQ